MTKRPRSPEDTTLTVDGRHAVTATEPTTKSIAATPAAATRTGPPPRLPALDAAALAGLPHGFEQLAEDGAAQLAHDLTVQGGRGSAARAALARDVVVSAARLRCLQAEQATAMGSEDLVRVTRLDRLIDSEHRRWMASLDALARLDPAPISAVRITAHQAAVTVNR